MHLLITLIRAITRRRNRKSCDHEREAFLANLQLTSQMAVLYLLWGVCLGDNPAIVATMKPAMERQHVVYLKWFSKRQPLVRLKVVSNDIRELKARDCLQQRWNYTIIYKCTLSIYIYIISLCSTRVSIFFNCYFYLKVIFDNVFLKRNTLVVLHCSRNRNSLIVKAGNIVIVVIKILKYYYQLWYKLR